MPWNEPGKKNSGNQDPWGNNRRNGNGGSNPLNLEKWLRRLIGKLRANGNGSGSGNPASGVLLLVVVAAIAWLASGFYLIDSGQRGVVLRFGAYVKTSSPGAHWHLPYPVETVYAIDVDQTRSTEVKETMLTRDNNLLDVDVSAQYRVQNPEDYMFNARNPSEMLRSLLKATVRKLVGQLAMDDVTGSGQAGIETRALSQIQQSLDHDRLGLKVTRVNLLSAQPPAQVRSVFADAIKAREDAMGYRNQAKAYADRVIAEARGQATRQLEEAQAYQQEVVVRAQGDVSRFKQLLKQYEKAPGVTRERMYLDTLQSVLSNSSKVLVDTTGKNILYLPVGKMVSPPAGASVQPNTDLGTATPPVIEADPMQAERVRRGSRSRGGR